MPPAVLREHQRILAAYGGVYNDPRLQSMIEQTVERLVAASERPDLHYKVTMLNSQSVNAFALPTGQLYVTRGLIALANDESELASVLAHEMGHVIARHAEMREEQARHADLGSRVVTDVVSDPEAGALALAKSKLALASFSQAQEFEADAIGIGIAVARRLRSLWRGAIPHLDGAQFRAQAAAERRHQSERARLPVVASGDARAHHQRARQCAPIPSRRRPTRRRTWRRPRPPISATSTASCTAKTRAKASCAAGASCIPSSASPSRRPDGFTLDNTAQAVLGVKHGGGQALRLDVVRVPAEQTLADYLTSGWIENIDPASVRGRHHQRLPGATAAAKGDQWDFRLYAIRFGSDVYRFIFAAKHRTPETDRIFRELVGTFRRMSLAEIEQAKPLHLKIVTVGPGDTVEKLAGRMAIADRAGRALPRPQRA